MLQTTWDTTVGYLSAVRADRELKYGDIIPGVIRATIHPKKGQYAFAPLGSGAVITPWHGTGVITAKGEINADFLLPLQDQGFVPVYSDLFDRGVKHQPLFMAPSTAIKGDNLNPDFLQKARLRRD